MRTSEELERRTLDVLRSIVEGYLSFGEPVGSRTLSKQPRFALSAATIRNIMADLEEAGLLAQPHTSAGRVPTEAALRWYVDQLPKHALGNPDETLIQESLEKTQGDLLAMLDVASRLLAHLTRYAGIILLPRIDAAVVAHVEFVRLGPARILVILATTAGAVQHKVVDVAEDYTAAELDRLGQFILERYRGLTLGEARRRTALLMQEEREEVDRLTRAALDLAGRTFAGADSVPELHIEGALNILETPEFSDAVKVRALLKTLEDKERLLRILDEVISGQGLQVIIGSETHIADMTGISVVSAAYGTGPTAGALGVIGPTRMDYDRTVTVVGRMAGLLSHHLAGSTGPAVTDPKRSE